MLSPFSRVRSILSASIAMLVGLPMTGASQESLDETSEIGENTISVDYTYSHLNDIDSWHEGSLSLGRETSLGTFIARANYAHRFSQDGVQVELDGYPAFGDRFYAYVNAGYAESDLFPAWRFGGELYSSLPGAWEASLGARHLRFDDFNLTLYTGSVGKYYGNYWFSLRPYAQMDEGDLTGSATAYARRYYADADEYVGAQVGYGSSPNDRVSPTEIDFNTYFSASAQGVRRIGSDLLAAVVLAYDREEIGPERIRHRVGLTTGMRVEF